VASPGCEDRAPLPKIDRALLKALARAHRWQRMLEEGALPRSQELAEGERISRWTSAASCASPSSPPTLSSASWTGVRLLGSRGSWSHLPSNGKRSCRDSYERSSATTPRVGTASLYRGGGYTAAHGAARSTCAASAMINASPYGCPTSWTPIGRPLSVQLNGREIAGCPEILNG
jgi:hypothetical protein